MSNSAFELSRANQGATLLAVNQPTHNLNVDDWVYLNGANYEKAQANAEATSFVVGVVVFKTDDDNFSLQMGGNAVGLTGLISGTIFYLSSTVAGALQNTAPTGSDKVVPLIAGNSTTSGVMLVLGEKGGGSGSSSTHTVDKGSPHGFVVGDVLRIISPGVYTKALADTPENAEVIGIVVEASNPNIFTVQQSGFMTGLPTLVGDSVYFLDAVTPGAITLTPTTTIGQVNAPVLHTDGTNTGWVLPYRGNTIEAATQNSQYDIAMTAGFDAAAVPEDILVQDYVQLIMARTGSFTGEVGFLDVAATGSAFILDVKKNGVSIYTTLPRFADGVQTLTAGVLKTDGSQNFAPNNRITMTVTQAGVTTPGQGLRFTTTGEV